MNELTKLQQEILDAYIASGYNKSDTARALGKSRSCVRASIHLIEKKGLAPWLSEAPLPDTLNLHKTTVQYSANGTVLQEWRRLTPGAEAFEEFCERLCDKVRGNSRVKKRREKKTDTDDILGEISMFDSHLNMRAEKVLTGDEDYDTEIAVSKFLDGVEGIASRFARPKKLILTIGGDALHSDNRKGTTEQSNHTLDMDTRYETAIDMLVAMCRDAVNMAASVSEEVLIVVLRGNHDPVSMTWLSRVLSAYFENTPHVNILEQDTSRKCLTFGKTMLSWAHGDGVKWTQWPELIATEFAEQWGQTKYRYHKIGHLHHLKSNAPARVAKESVLGLEEMRGLTVELLSSTAAADYYHAHNGYIGAIKMANGFEYHREKGCLTRFHQPV